MAKQATTMKQAYLLQSPSWNDTAAAAATAAAVIDAVTVARWY